MMKARFSARVAVRRLGRGRCRFLIRRQWLSGFVGCRCGRRRRAMAGMVFRPVAAPDRIAVIAAVATMAAKAAVATVAPMAAVTEQMERYERRSDQKENPVVGDPRHPAVSMFAVAAVGPCLSQPEPSPVVASDCAKRACGWRQSDLGYASCLPQASLGPKAPPPDGEAATGCGSRFMIGSQSLPDRLRQRGTRVSGCPISLKTRDPRRHYSDIAAGRGDAAAARSPRLIQRVACPAATAPASRLVGSPRCRPSRTLVPRAPDELGRLPGGRLQGRSSCRLACEHRSEGSQRRHPVKRAGPRRWRKQATRPVRAHCPTVATGPRADRRWPRQGQARGRCLPWCGWFHGGTGV